MKGVDVNARTDEGVTALMFASQDGHLDMVRALLESNADINAKANNGATALLLAIEGDHSKVAELLRQRGRRWCTVDTIRRQTLLERVPAVYNALTAVRHLLAQTGVTAGIGQCSGMAASPVSSLQPPRR